MSKLTSHAKKELEIIGAFDKDGDYDGMIGKDVIELMEVFAKQGHSGMSASIVRDLFYKLSAFKPLSSLRFTDDEWNENPGGREDMFQNNRNSAVFKEGKNGKPYYIGSYVMEKEPGNCWDGLLLVEGNKRIWRCYIKDQSDMPTIVVRPEVVQHSKEMSDWDFLPVPESALDELREHYDVELVELVDSEFIESVDIKNEEVVDQEIK